MLKFIKNFRRKKICGKNEKYPPTAQGQKKKKKKGK